LLTRGGHESKKPHAVFVEKIGKCSFPKNSNLLYDNPGSEAPIQTTVLDSNLVSTTANKFAVVQDNFHNIMGNTYTFNELETACADCIKKSKANDSVGYHMKQITTKCIDVVTGTEHASRSKFFVSKGFDEDTAKACAFVLSFYTGHHSDTVQTQCASLIVRQANTVNIEEFIKNNGNPLPILFYLVQALSVLPYYWGPTVRCIALTEPEIQFYNVGDIVMWLQFSSSIKGTTPAANFKSRNVHFHIHSLTARRISHLSNFQIEDEALFLPHSAFIVVSKVSDNQKWTIHLRQIELGLSNKTVMWVDDNILNYTWENRKIMENAASVQVNKNIHFVPKPTTELAISFLSSEFGKRLKKPEFLGSFRIVSDMNRTNETPSHNAGARLIRQVITLGFTNKILIFTSDEEKAITAIRLENSGAIPPNVIVTASTNVAQKFIHFEDEDDGQQEDGQKKKKKQVTT